MHGRKNIVQSRLAAFCTNELLTESSTLHVLSNDSNLDTNIRHNRTIVTFSLFYLGNNTQNPENVKKIFFVGV